MKKIFISLFTSACIVFQIGCKPAASENANLTNVNSATPAPTAAIAGNANANAAPAAATPLPTFTNADAALAEGKKLLDADETEKSVEALRQAVKLNPELAEAHFNLGIALALLENERTDETPAEEPTPAAKAKSKSKNTSKKKEELELTDSQKSFAKAAEIYEKLTKKDEKNDQAFFDLGRCYNKLNEDEKAEKAFRQAVKLKPDDAYYQTQLGDILIKLSHYDNAIVALKKAKSLDPNDLQIQDLLEKAEAGEKRIKFGAKPTPQQAVQQQQQAASKSKGNAPRQRPTPSLKINEAPLPKQN